jgi:ribonuclease HI
MRIIAYTDGSACVNYPKLGGFGVYIKTQEKNIKIRKGYCNTKTGRMELMAALTCMRSVQNKQSELIIYADSQYVCNTVNEWIDNWKVMSYQDKANKDILEQLYIEIHKFDHRPRCRHIKGHQEVSCEHTLGNNIADELASYRTQISYELDLPLQDLAIFELEDDYYTLNDKIYYKRNDSLVR